MGPFYACVAIGLYVCTHSGTVCPGSFQGLILNVCEVPPCPGCQAAAVVQAVRCTNLGEAGDFLHPVQLFITVDFSAIISKSWVAPPSPSS